MTDEAGGAEGESIAGVRAGTRGRLLNLLMRTYFKRKAARLQLDPAGIADARATLEKISRLGGREDAALRIRDDRVAGRPVEIVEPVSGAGAGPRILYLHGGAFLAGSPRTHRGITRRLARQLDAQLIVPDYCLAPEHPYPAALNECVGIYRELLARSEPGQLVVAGDSAGGNLVLTVLLAAREQGLPMPAAAVAISPWSDLTGSGGTVISMARRDAMLPAEKLSEAARAYAGDADLGHPALSPVFAEYAGFPPLLLHASTHEILLDDARRVLGRARAAGVDAQLRLWRSLPHVFHAFSDFLPAARVALDEISDFIRRHTRPTGETGRA